MNLEQFREHRACANCIYWEGIPEYAKDPKTGKRKRTEFVDFGYCRIHPPVFAKFEKWHEWNREAYYEEERLGAWPQTMCEDWCGGWVLDETSKYYTEE